MGKFWQFLTNMDARWARAVGVSLGLLLTVALILFFGKSALGQAVTKDFVDWLEGFRDSPFGLIATILVFTAAAFIGAPQFVLIAACVVAFGPWLGFLYAWIGTAVSAAATYGVGRFASRAVLDRISGGHLGRLTSFVGNNAFVASFVIRNVPSAPFIVVNMAFGMARAPFMSFLTGCALGSVPKTALVAIFGKSILDLGDGQHWQQALLMAALGGVWLALMLGARHLLQKSKISQRIDD